MEKGTSIVLPKSVLITYLKEVLKLSFNIVSTLSHGEYYYFNNVYNILENKYGRRFDDFIGGLVIDFLNDFYNETDDIKKYKFLYKVYRELSIIGIDIEYKYLDESLSDVLPGCIDNAIDGLRSLSKLTLPNVLSTPNAEWDYKLCGNHVFCVYLGDFKSNRYDSLLRDYNTIYKDYTELTTRYNRLKEEYETLKFSNLHNAPEYYIQNL